MANQTDQSDIKAMSFEQALKELETSTHTYARGEALKTHCDCLLRKGEARVEKICLNQNGQPTGTEPLDVKG